MMRPSWWTEADERQVALLHSLGSLGESEADAHARLALIGIIEDAEEGEQQAQLGDAAPALARWGREVLAGTGRRSALEKAAAWELAALQYEARGNEERAEAARRRAELIVENAAA